MLLRKERIEARKVALAPDAVELITHVNAYGLAAFKARDPARTAEYSFERVRRFGPREITTFKANPKAWAFFAALPAGYKGVSVWYIISAKREETRAKRLALLIACSAKGERLPGLPQPRART